MHGAYIPVARCLDPDHGFASLKRSKSFRVRLLRVFASIAARGVFIAELDGAMQSQRGFTLMRRHHEAASAAAVFWVLAGVPAAIAWTQAVIQKVTKRPR